MKMSLVIITFMKLAVVLCKIFSPYLNLQKSLALASKGFASRYPCLRQLGASDPLILAFLKIIQFFHAQAFYKSAT